MISPAEYAAERERNYSSMKPEEAEIQSANEAIIAAAKRDGKQGNLVMDAKGRMQVLDEMAMGADCGRYAWGQNEDEVLIKVRVPAGTKSKLIKLDGTTSSKLKLTVVGEVILDAELYAKCRPDDNTFTIEDDGDGRLVTVSLAKMQKTIANKHWKCVCVGEPEIDTSKFGPGVMSADPNDPNGIARLMESGMI